ncbi:MAG TPA: hypothetical protein VJR48_06520 [Ktedonobacterales bacterium]|nr:hypothetical protein [Ktedonobacterales bacterium]
MAKHHPYRSDSTQRSTTRARRDHAAQGLHRKLARALGNAAFVLLALSALGLAIALVLSATRPSTSGLTGGVQAESNSPNNPPVNGDWITLQSASPADIIAAARRSELFNEHGSTKDDHVANLSHLGTPVFVRAIQPPGAAAGEYPDFYVLPILDNKGAVTDAAELALNPTHTAIHVIAIVTYAQPHTEGAIPRLNPAAAQSALSAQRHMALRSGTTPALAYFPADATAQETGQTLWSGGGTFPADPIWLTSGADGRNYVIGTDGRVYDVSQLPMVHEGP